MPKSFSRNHFTPKQTEHNIKNKKIRIIIKSFQGQNKSRSGYASLTKKKEKKG
jgi:ATP sulfurylase